MIVLAISFAFIASFVSAAPQASSSVEVSSNKYSPYNFEYKVEDAEQKVYHDRTESQDDNGEVRARADTMEKFCAKKFANLYLVNFNSHLTCFSLR